MWIISKSRLREFWESPGKDDSKSQLTSWYAVVSKAKWQTFAELKGTYGNASLVGDCVVFNVAGNKYRLVTRVRFLQHKVFILKIMSHEEYDKSKWKTQCGCFSSDTSDTARKPHAGNFAHEEEPVRKRKGR
jgi:mRNA interferase HigB